MKFTFLILGTAIVACCVGALNGVQDDRRPTSGSLVKANPPVQAIYGSKFRIESPTDRRSIDDAKPVAYGQPVLDQGASAGATRADAAKTKTAAGKVQWHDDFNSACRASRETGKPVLLFQLMGQLDEVFC